MRHNPQVEGRAGSVQHARILIVGAGIAGLALGRALLARGLAAEIVERAAVWPTVGTGLYLPGNGVRALAALGLGGALMARAVRISHQRILDHRGRLLAEIDLPSVWGRVGPCVGIRRSDLHEILLEGAVGVPIRLGQTVRAVTQTRDQVSVQFNDALTQSYDVVVGADGIHSSIRRLVFGNVQPRGTGHTSWRFIAPHRYGVTTWTAMLGHRRTFLMMPVGSGGLYCYADHRTTAELRPSDPRDQLRLLFEGFGAPVPQLAAQLDRMEAIHTGAIEEICMERSVDRRVALVGDAAHATSPNMAQGASMALEDALILSDELSGAHSPVDALAAFAARRHGRIRWVRARTHKRDRVRALPGLVRNLALRTAGASIYKADYRPLLDEP